MAIYQYLRAKTPAGDLGLRFVVMALVDSVGTGVFVAGAVVYFTEAAHLSSAQIGIGLSLSATIGSCTTYIVGILSDRHGARRMLLLLCLWRAVGFAAYGFVQNWTGYLLVVSFVGLADHASSPVLQALIADVIPPEVRVALLGVVRAVRNVGFALGALFATIPLMGLGIPLRSIVFIDAASFAVAAWLVWRMPRTPARSHEVANPTPTAKPWRDLRYVGFVLIAGLLNFDISILNVALPLWILHGTSVPRVWISPLLVLNTLLAVVFQARVARAVTTHRRAVVAMVVAGTADAVACALLGIAGFLAASLGCVCLIAGVVSLTVGELSSSAGTWFLSYDLIGDERRRGAYLALFGLARSVEGIVAPPILTSFVIPLGFPGWLLLGAPILLAGLLTRRLAAPSPKAQPAADALE